MEWAQVRALVADGVSEREIARRLGINRRTVARLARSEEFGQDPFVEEVPRAADRPGRLLARER